MKGNFSIICALTRGTRGIGFKNRLPWGHIKEDMDHFSRMTTKTTKTTEPHKTNAVIMGRKTWESIPKQLPGRLNIVITSKTHDNKRKNHALIRVDPAEPVEQQIERHHVGLDGDENGSDNEEEEEP